MHQPAPPYLTGAEIADICHPLRQHHAQVRYLQGLGLKVARKPNGQPLVARSEFERVMVGRQAEDHAAQNGSGQPNRAALLQLFQGGGRNGKKAQGQQPQPA